MIFKGRNIGYLWGILFLLLISGWSNVALSQVGSSPIKDRYGDPISNPEPQSPITDIKPSNIKTEYELDSNMRTITVKEKVGDIDYRPPTTLTFEEFAEYQNSKMKQEQWKESVGEKDEKAPDEEGLFGGPIIVGKNGEPIVEVIPSGNVTLEFGGRWQKVDNPAIPVRQQRTGGFEFDQQIRLNIQGNIGDRLKITANWDTKATFDFDNSIKIQFQGKEEDIIKSIEAGNVSFPLKNSLIRGAQNLFGVKAEMQFGKLWVTTLFSNQRGKTETLVIKGGAQSKRFDKKASEYDYYRHYFIDHFFRDNFEGAFKNNATYPNFGARITRVEVYVTNSSTNTEGLRNIVGVTDLGVGKQSQLTNTNVNILDGRPSPPSYNRVNDLYDNILNYPQFRSIDSTEIVFNNLLNLDPGVDYEVIKSARQLIEGVDFTFHQELGYISLNSRIDEEEGLAVAFEYTLNGETYKVGELKEDYQTQAEDKVIMLKLLKPQSIRTNLPNWDLLMKNVYSLNTTGIKQNNFQLRVIYFDDISNVDNPFLREGQNMAKVPLVEVMRLDKLNRNGDFAPDKNFDFIEGATINSKKGLVIFPVLEPFGSHLTNQSDGYGFDPISESNLVNKYVFNTLYESTYNDAERQTEKDKFHISGQYESVAGEQIMLPGINILPGSVTITSGSMTLREGSDFTVDYNIGRVVINNEGVLASGKEIIIKYEKSDIFNFRTKSLFGTRLEYRFSDDFQLGTTWLYMNERPLLTRVNLGDEPIKNHQFGIDLKFHDESRVLTELVDALPVVQTKAESTIDVNWEAAALAPAKSKITNGEAYLEDFEGAETPYDLSRSPYRWNISSTPRYLGSDNIEYADWQSNDLDHGFHRAKLSWYNIDNTVYTSNNALDIESDDFQESIYTSRIVPQEIFPNQENAATINLNLTPLDLVYVPDERGPYNYNNVDINPDGKFTNPEDNWAGIQRAVTFDTDFDKSNISFIEFWLLNPFYDNLPNGLTDTPQPNTTGGDVYFHLGNISEDVLKDNRHAFENGLPENVAETIWGNVTTEQFIVNAFDNDNSVRQQQDVGLDGLNNAGERTKYDSIINTMPLNSAARSTLLADPSSDDFVHYGGNDDRTAIQRYLKFAGLENNSPVNDGSSFTRASTNLPNNEDLNGDNTLNKEDSYYEYHLPLQPGSMNTSSNPFIVGQEGGSTTNPKWVQVRIPVKDPNVYKKIGNIDGFKTIKFIRTYLTGWAEPVVLRMAQFQLVGAQWVNMEDTKYISQTQGGIANEFCDESFSFSTVNIEENGKSTENNSGYVVPPGVIRDIDNLSPNRRQLNEQSLKLQAVDLCPGKGRAVFKNMGHDILNYKRIKMFIHAESGDYLSSSASNTNDDEVIAFLRLGTDNTSNYYQIEVPLKLSDVTSSDPYEVWKVANEIDVGIQDLIDTKIERTRNGFSPTKEYSRQVDGRTLVVKGNPDMSAVVTYMIGVRNQLTNSQPKSIIIWTDELRVADFNDDIQRVGIATRGTVDLQLADLGTVQASGGLTSVGYGDIEQKLSERSREQTVEYGVATNLALDKLVPGNGIQLPLYASYDKKTVTPQYSPGVAGADVLLEDDPQNETDPNFKDKVISKTEVRSINLTNVKVKTTKDGKKPKIYSPDNLSVSAGITETRASGLGNDFGRGKGVESHLEQVYKGSIGYQYTTDVKSIEPFKKTKFLGNKYGRIIKDINFNPLPNSFGIRADLNRTYIRTQLYNDNGNGLFETEGVDPSYEKSYFFDRTHNLRWDFTKSINASFNSTANSIIDEPEGNKNGDDLITRREYRDSIWTNIQQFGRIKNYAHQIKVSYDLPLSKIPLINWLDAEVSYNSDYRWTASALGLADTNDIALGNVIGNQQDINMNGKINLNKLYNKSKFLKEINSPRSKRSRRRSSPKTKKDGEEEEEEEEKEPKEMKGVKSALRFLMMVQNINLKYTQSRATTMAGFLPSPDFIGLDGSTDAPGYGFVAGSQDANIRTRAAQNGWLSESPSQNNPFIQDNQQNFTLSGNLEPANDIRIRVDMKKSVTSGYSEIFRVDTLGGDFQTFNPVVFGNTSMSYLMIGTSDIFSYSGDKNFTQLENNRNVVRRRLEDRNNGPGSYGLNSQDVLIPAFLSAYSGKDANEVNLNYAPKVPLPNWQVDYNGLAKMKWFKDRFSSITFSHSYSSTYSVTSFKSSLEYDESVINPGTQLNSSFENGNQPTAVNENGEYIPVVIINEVTLAERFAPLLGVRVRTKNRMDFRAEYKTERMFNLDMGNTQVTELYSKDFVFGFGYTARGLNIKTKRKDIINIPKTKDIIFKLDFALRDTKTIQRTLDGTDVTTAGNLSIRLYPNITYAITQKLNMQIFFERTINEPRVSSSFRRTSTAFGFKLQFDLS